VRPAGAALRQRHRGLTGGGAGAVGAVALRVSTGMLIVTTNDLPGYIITRVLGAAVGVTARPMNKYTEGVRAVSADLSGTGEQYLVAGRQEAISRMAMHASQAGANAILAMRFDHRTVSEDWMEICAYGTAVWADAIDVPLDAAAGMADAPVSPSPVPPGPQLAMYEATMAADAPTSPVP